MPSLSDAEAEAVATGLWERINLVNLRENILPTRPRADLILRKGADHAMRRSGAEEALRPACARSLRPRDARDRMIVALDVRKRRGCAPARRKPRRERPPSTRSGCSSSSPAGSALIDELTGGRQADLPRHEAARHRQHGGRRGREHRRARRHLHHDPRLSEGDARGRRRAAGAWRASGCWRDRRSPRWTMPILLPPAMPPEPAALVGGARRRTHARRHGRDRLLAARGRAPCEKSSGRTWRS